MRMSDVAREAGVSPMTVSNVVNGRPGVKAETRQRVLEAVERLGYRPNATARLLRGGRSGAIGLLVPDVDTGYYAHLAARLGAVAEAHGYHVVTERTGGTREGELGALYPARVAAYDAIVMSPVVLDAGDLRAARIERPCVLLGERPLPGPFPHVMMDNIGGSMLATEHLLRAGARRIALVGGRRAVAFGDMASLRSVGYRRAHGDAGIEVDDDLIVEVGSYSMRDGYDAVLALHAEQVDFDAAFVLTDAAAMGVLRALADIGRRVPQDVQVVGFDNDAEADFTIPRLTTVEPGNDAMAREIVRLLLAQTGDGGRPPGPGDRVAEARLVVRESTLSARDVRSGR
ncbi:LacI family transcriptional regulator [Cellulomonas carbonis T26]|uniref:LacI family transcriptional regulator n=2 Tax=Cellulomonas carbonis TaxID=1386092 RepID=A0A0A0BVK6_9CELL|nr:LacI family transcriptional regulator [Cellulomonas carbonis T26]